MLPPKDELERIVETIPDGVIILDNNGYITFANTTAERLLGLTKSQIIGRAYNAPEWKRVTVEGKPFPEEELPFAQAMRAGRPVYGIEVVLEHPDGTMVTLSINATPLKDEKGAIIGVVASLTDITEREKAEVKLKESERRFRKVFEEGPIGIAITALDFRFIRANPRLCQILGYTEEELKKLTFSDVTYKEDVDAEINLAKELFNGKIPYFQIEKRYVRKSGEIFWISLTATVVRDEAGKPLYGIGMIEDINEKKRREELSDALNEINATISSTLDFDEMMRRTINKSTKAIGATSAMIVLREPNYWEIKYVYGIPSEVIDTKFTPEEAKATMITVKAKRPIITENAANGTKSNPMALKYGVRSFFSVPLIVKEDVIGVLFFNSDTTPSPFNEAELDFAGKLSISISLALENARFYQAERNIADTLQETILVMPERIEGAEFGYSYHSATEEARVGGDFYDIFEIEHNKIGFLVGDVSGKGLEATALVSVVKNTIKAHAYEDKSLALIMAKTNNLLEKTSPADSFVTVFFGVLNTLTGELSYCSAAHPPAIIKRGAKVELLSFTSPVIGAFTGFHYRSGKASLNKGDILILYTDGITEARADEEFFGEDRLVNFIERLKPTPAKDIPKKIFDYVMKYTDDNLTDDVAILTISLVDREEFL